MQIRNTEILNLPKSNGQKVRGKFSISASAMSPSHSKSFTTGYNNFNEKPLNHYSRELSFKGFSLSKAGKASEGALSRLSTLIFKGGEVEVKDYNKILDRVTSLLGGSLKSDFAEICRDSANRITIKEDKIKFQRKSILRLLGESLAYPVTGLPFDLANFGLKVLGKIPVFKKSATKLYESNFLKSKRAKLSKEEQFNGVMGMFDQLNKKLAAEGLSEKQKDSIIRRVSHGMFNPKKGKYNSVHERSLNRIVTAIIPAYFLANDAYNLSSFCDGDATMAKKEHDIRFNQEVSRLGITAYIQLVTLGGLTKFVNGSMVGSALSTTIPVLIGETSSRLANGKSITFISKEQAQQMAQERGVITIKENKEQQKNDLIYKYYPMPVAFARAAETFTAFKGQNANTAFSSFDNENNKKIIGTTAGLVSQATSKRDKQNNKKPILSLDRIEKWIAFSVVLGVNLKTLRMNKKADQVFKAAFEPFKKMYSKLAKKDFILAKTEFEDIISKLRAADKNEIADWYKEIMTAHEKDTDKVINIMQQMLAKSGTPEFDKLLVKNSKFLKAQDINTKNFAATLKDQLEYLINTTKSNYKLPKIDTKIKPVIDCVIAPFDFLWCTAKFPYYCANSLIELFIKSKSKKTEKDIQLLSRVITDIRDQAKKMTTEDFSKFYKQNLNASFNNTTKSDYDNAELAKVTKLIASAITTWFLIADDYNMVMMKSLGADESGALLKAKERGQQRLAGFMSQFMFINLFNDVFRKFYNSSLIGMSLVAGACTVVSEIFTRKSIGKPVGEMSRSEINELEANNINSPGIKGKYFRFMTELTGKKAISGDAQKSKIV